MALQGHLLHRQHRGRLALAPFLLGIDILPDRLGIRLAIVLVHPRRRREPLLDHLCIVARLLGAPLIFLVDLHRLRHNRCPCPFA